MPPPAAPSEQQEQQQSVFRLLALPEPLLLAVLQCLAAGDDQQSLFSAVRAHSKLHQAVAALRSVAVQEIRQQQVLDGVLAYLSKHGHHVSSVSLGGVAGTSLSLVSSLQQLPPTLQLHSLGLEYLQVQLLPGKGCQGVLGPPAAGLLALKQLRLKGCVLLEGHKGFAAAISQLPPGLEHLSIDGVCLGDRNTGGQAITVTFPMGVLQQPALQQLTHLELLDVLLQGPDPSSPALQPLQALSRLADLRLATLGVGAGQHAVLTASMLSGATGLTRLELKYVDFELGVLAGKTQLQHLALLTGEPPEDAAWTAQLLSHVASLQQLTHLRCPDVPGAHPTAYSALTASSRLRHLCLTDCTLPAGVWAHVFPAGRQLPHLTALEAAYVLQPSDDYMAVPDGSCLISCCPGLWRLDVSGLEYSAGAFAAFEGLSALRTLTVSLTDAGEALREVCQLTGLRQLVVKAVKAEGELLLQTTKLRQLTRLAYNGQHNGRMTDSAWVTEEPDDEPVWRRVLQRHLDHSDPTVAQAAAAALLEAE